MVFALDFVRHPGRASPYQVGGGSGGCWVSIIAGRPFTLQYARESVPEAYWRTPGFIHTGYFISIVWGIIFLIALGASLFRPYLDQMAGWLYPLLATGNMFLGIIFTQWYVHRVRKTRQT